MASDQWPTSREYVEAIQAPRLCFDDADLKQGQPALDRFGLPTVTSGQFAYVFKINHPPDVKADAVRCFRSSDTDREIRYQHINRHLDLVNNPYLASFEYDPNGIRVAGKMWPTIVMEWIEGHSLDVYLDRVVGKPEALKYLAEMWLKTLRSLRDQGIAHGDLQHGNILIDSATMLRLVDLDGMYVPSMQGRPASEIGHRHYQHPGRNASHFGPTLDNFSGLVIYLSLLALKDSPGLWSRYHDENLILVKQDFEHPKRSPALSAVQKLGGDCALLAEALTNACREDPLSCPSVLDLVTAPGRMPAWMTDGPAVSVSIATREVRPGATTGPAPVAAQAPTTAPPPAEAPWWQQASGVPAPVSAPSVGPPPPQAVPAGVPLSTSWKEAGLHSVTYAFLGIFISFLWFPLLRGLMSAVGVAGPDTTNAALALYFAICGFAGYQRAKTRTSASPSPTGPPPGTATRYVPPVVTVKPTPPSRPMPSLSASAYLFVGSRMRRKFHRPTCEWARQISARNRVTFQTTTEARSAGYRPCGVCKP